MRPCPLVISVLLLVLSAIVLPSQASAAASRPYASRGTAHFVSPTDFVGSGYATHLGVYSEAGTVSFSPTDDPAVLRVTGSIVYTAANGDELHANVVGDLNMATGAVSAQLTYAGGAGRFDDATGSATLSGRLSPTGVITVGVRGTIDY